MPNARPNDLHTVGLNVGTLGHLSYNPNPGHQGENGRASIQGCGWTASLLAVFCSFFRE